MLILIGLMAPAIAAEPFINEVIPGSGAVGTDVFIEGGNFVFGNVSSNKVKFNGVRATVVEAKEATRLRVKVPAGAANGPVTVTNSNSNGKESPSPNFFTVTAPVSSNKGAMGKGDRIHLKTGVYGFTLVQNKCFKADGSTADMDPNLQYAAPAGSVLSVVSDADKDGNITASFPGRRPGSIFCDSTSASCGNQLVSKGNLYKISLSTLQSASSTTVGFDYGTLIVPFKFHFTDHTVTGNSSVVQYLGYKLSFGALSLMPVVSAGLGVVDITQQNGTTTSSSSAPSFSVAYGIILDVLKNGLFQTGIMSGWDWAGKGSQYKYEGSPWISISIGTNWTN